MVGGYRATKDAKNDEKIISIINRMKNEIEIRFEKQFKIFEPISYQHQLVKKKKKKI